MIVFHLYATRRRPPCTPPDDCPFDELLPGAGKSPRVRECGCRVRPAGRRLYVYTNRCVYDNGWDDFSMLARGLILHPATRRVIATPFPKFFNAGERGLAIPAMSV